MKVAVEDRASDIIHAGGVRSAFSSSAPQVRAALWKLASLTGLAGTLDLVT